MSSRLALLFVALLTITAGCNSAHVATTTDGTTQSTTAPSTTTASSCTTTYQPNNPGLPANETRELPEKPGTLNATSVENLVRETEQVVPYNERYKPRFEYVAVDIGDVDVEETDDGYEVTINHVEWTTSEFDGEHTVAGSTAWSAYYAVNESSIARSQAYVGVNNPPEPAILHCWNSTA